jgi:hypothetical protein
MKMPSAPPPNMDYISLQRAKSFARKHGQATDPAVTGFSTLSTGYDGMTAHLPKDLDHRPTSDRPASNVMPPAPPVYEGLPPSSKPPDLDYIAVQRAQSFARKRTSESQAASAAAVLGGAAFMKEALADAGGQNNAPPGPPKSLLAKHPSLLLQFRPARKDATTPKRLECFAARAQSEQIRLLFEATRTPYDLHVHFLGESANPDEYRSRANQLGELPLYIGEELGKGAQFPGGQSPPKPHSPPTQHRPRQSGATRTSFVLRCRKLVRFHTCSPCLAHPCFNSCLQTKQSAG